MKQKEKINQKVYVASQTFNVFIELEVDCRRYLTYETLKEQRNETCNYVENILQNDKKQQKNFY